MSYAFGNTMQPPHQWLFGPFRLDPANALCWRGEQVIPLTPKAFDMLCYLVAHAGQLVTKDDLLEALWPETEVSEAVLKVRVNELRKVLGDIAQAPQFIATVRRRGYRFIAPVTPISHPAKPSTVPLSPVPVVSVRPAFQATQCAPGDLVEREAELQQLHAWLERVRQGEHQVVFVSGEAGIGKTSVVEAFLAQATADPTLWLARGQCIEHYGPCEAYMPIIEAVGRLCREPGHERLLTLLRQNAPLWLLQMPWLLSAADRESLLRQVGGATQEQMLLGLAEVFEAVTAETPLVLVLEDLHWSDYATLDLVAFLARRRESTRLLLIGTYRPGEVLAHEHPLRMVKADLQRQGYGVELPLALLSEAAVAEYIQRRFAGCQFPTTLARMIHRPTDGNPLFVVSLVDDLVRQGVVTASHGQWTVRDTFEAEELRVSEGLREMLTQQLDRLTATEQRLLEAASARGQGAMAWELRAAISLGRLWQCQGKLGEAQQLLAGVYGWFTEGFDTVDLQAAQVLLQGSSG